jgi:hypothetical protein
MMGMSMASAPMTMQSGQMAYRPMVPMTPMTAMTAPYAANQPMNVRDMTLCLFVCFLLPHERFPCIYLYFTFYLFI